MSTELEKLFSPDVLAALDERARQIAEQVLKAREVTGCVKVSTACTMLDMNEYRVRQLIREGKLKVIHPTPNTIRIPLSEIRRFTEEQS
jgi:hypothetical protein